MRPLRLLSLLLAFMAATGLVLGSFGFMAMQADRGMNVSIADDDEAYLGFHQVNDTAISGEQRIIVEYENRFGVTLDDFSAGDVRVDEPTGNTHVETVEDPESIGVGEVGVVAVTLHCPESETVDLVFDASASGSGASVSASRTRSVTCLAPNDELSVEFVGTGSGHVEVDGHPAFFPLTEVIIHWEQGNDEHATTISIEEPGEKIEGREDINGKIIAVEIPVYGVYEESSDVSVGIDEGNEHVEKIPSFSQIK